MNEYALTLQTNAAKRLREQLQLVTDDEDAIRDTIEGEYDLAGCIAYALDLITEDEIQSEGIAAIMRGLAARQSRAELRIQRRRTAIASAMEAGELRKLTLPQATLSLRNVQPKVEVIEGTILPPRFFDSHTVTSLNKARLKEALDAKEQIPGAMLSNGSVSLTIRRG